MRYRLRILFTRIARRLIGAIGGVLLSKQAAENLTTQRDLAVLELATIENRSLKPGLVGIVMSKDRALQLYSLLSTYRELVINPAPLTVIYNASTIEHANAYEEVKALIFETSQNIKFVEETDGFRKTLLKILDEVQVKNIFFLVDDIVFIRNIDLTYANTLDTSRYVLSLRHSPYLTRSYTGNRSQMPPKLSKFRAMQEMFEFRWFEEGSEWSDPWSVDGQVLSTAEVRIITKVSTFSAPNSYEAALKSFNTLCVERRGLCYSESKILNLPINRVQNECENLSGSVSPEYLLDQWCKGMMLDTSNLLTHIPQSPHEEHLVVFKIRPFK
ncbi:hypothetical protein KKA14_18950 [bacterium]|nr:hypothetical protein [bacterium]